VEARRRSSDGNPVVALPGIQDELLEILAHELRAPLNAARWLAEVLEASADDLSPEEVRRASGSLLRSLRYVGSLLESMLAEADAFGAIRLERSSVKVDDLVRETVEDMSSMLRGRLVAISVDGDPVASLDRDRIRQTLIALLANASRYSPERSPISVRVTGRRGTVDIVVADHCAGIPPTARHAVFELRTRMDHAGEGRGLGLFVARRLARAHGGDLRVVSSPSWGCRFIVTLPRSAHG
jgi:signal transduction histidine kinase